MLIDEMKVYPSTYFVEYALAVAFTLQEEVRMKSYLRYDVKHENRTLSTSFS